MPYAAALGADPELRSLMADWREADGQFDRSALQAGESFSEDYEAEIVSLAAAALLLIEQLRERTKAWLEGGGIRRLFSGGAADVGSGSLDPSEVAASDAVAEVLWGKVEAASVFAAGDIESFVARVNASTAGTAARTRLQSYLARQGIGKVLYSNGARHPLGSHLETILATESTVAFNAGTLVRADRLGLTHVEISDGPDCGLVSHKDSEKAHGLVVELRVAAAFPLAHPRCQRSFGQPTKAPSDLQSRSATSLVPNSTLEAAITAFSASNSPVVASGRQKRPSRTRTRRKRPTRQSRAGR